MSDIFNPQIKEALENAQKLKMVGEAGFSKELSVKTVKKVSNYHGVDLIELFYGAQAYKGIQDATDAAKYIFISNCLVRIYDVIAPLEAASSSVAAWAIADDVNSNKQLEKFFEWLKTPKRKVLTEDCKKFKMFLESMSSKDIPHFKMSDRVKQFTLVEIIKMLVAGTLNIVNGELR